MINIVSIRGTELSVSLNPLATDFTIGEDTTLRKIIADEVAISGKKFWHERAGVLYLENGISLHLAALVASALEADEELTALIGQSFNFVIGFDSSIYVLAVQIGKEGVVIDSEALLTKEDGLSFISENLANSVYFVAGSCTEEIESTGCKKSDVVFALSQSNTAFVFKRAWETARIISVTFYASMIALALYFSAIFVLSLLPEDVVIVPDTSPRITPNLAPIVRNIADQQSGYIPLLTNGLSTLGTKVQGIDVVMAASGAAEIDKITFKRLKAIASLLEGELLLGDSTWEIGGMKSVYSGVAVAPVKLVSLSEKMDSVIQLNSPRRLLTLGGIFARTSLTGSYSEYRSAITIKRPTKQFLYDFAGLIEEGDISAEYLGHSYTVKNGQLAALNLTFLLRGN